MRLTREQVAIHQAKNFPRSSSDPVLTRSAGSERQLHDQIVQCCNSNGWLIFHGSMAHRTFRTKGEPDFVIFLPHGKAILVECKTRAGKLSSEQLGVKMQAERVGASYHVIRSFSEFLELVQQTLNPQDTHVSHD